MSARKNHGETFTYLIYCRLLRHMKEIINSKHATQS